ncbi:MULTISPECIES: bifunctional adenosylcobinamide kinase/adenosylcobinamide-phosphate guanylyltransferase [unclassified Shewanella]|uniref:bifunctional adenosylcobinamide kinase/adenosylcobinamide-phosphate guanylyltransferase n=1 Tax=unclassified Shewanella TaxID=196818 RepID=UPI001BC0C834|nr:MULTISPECIES: bifunctional adenosylcobinamide kinase/adenosylcobinamide-phosphate guanylyltransferase [unclassified Shewanella]GIU17033.1 bifunctional adenosylcobalamin biosynthesis protein CobP [Shewanella sp. MBTL60-112-B1]GIU38765.1 bifunctional adenosylcobalamin biosynthesis protein CobP [Shewanella sp. MBTL60-112-B2]
MKQLIIGGARSGKSRLAQEYAVTWKAHTQGEVIVIATAEVSEGAMAKRIAHHKSHRPKDWRLIETCLDLPQALIEQSHANNLILVDCLTLWLSNCLLSEVSWQQYKQALLTAMTQLPGEVIFISNEVGQGIVPLGELSREFVDESGWLHQALAKHVDEVTMVVAGLPLVMKSATKTTHANAVSAAPLQLED